MEEVSVLEAAQAVSAAFSPAPPVHIVQTPSLGKPIERYVPDTHRARSELGLEQTIALSDAIQRTICWHRGIRAR